MELQSARHPIHKHAGTIVPIDKLPEWIQSQISQNWAKVPLLILVY
jgi:hypothetical protein